MESALNVKDEIVRLWASYVNIADQLDVSQAQDVMNYVIEQSVPINKLGN